MGTTIPSLLVTANVGSIFEEPEEMLDVWSVQFLKTVATLKPHFIALHCQEVGGKNYEKSMQHVENFVHKLMDSDELQNFDRVRVFLDEDYSSAQHFTALGNFYLIHKSLKDVQIWDFSESHFVKVIGKEVHSGNIESITTKEKAKFPQDFFPECKWSRKGFLRTRWSLEGTVIDFINLHLFHDASNFVAMEEFPSVYCKNRRRALEYTLNRFHTDRYGCVPYFVFGDFNFRMDTGGVIKELTKGLTTSRVQNLEKNDHSKFQYHDGSSQLVLTVGTKEFTHSEHQNVFLTQTPSDSWLRTLDREFSAFDDKLFEYPISFPPSYPFAENLKLGSSYMHTRCPSWCDRVLLSKTAKLLVSPEPHHKVQYNIMGMDTCMGDHKPVYLSLELLTNSGTITCNSQLCSAPLYPGSWSCCVTPVTISITDYSDQKIFINSSSTPPFDKSLLHERIYTKEMLAHDPYTPESAESQSPMATESTATSKIISPQILKSKLEDILLTNDDNQRLRCMSETLSNKPRVRLKSTSSLQSLPRFRDHHSSSDEEWFEEVVEENEPVEKDTLIIGELSNELQQTDLHKRKICCLIL